MNEATAAAPRPRFAQLTYSSFDARPAFGARPGAFGPLSGPGAAAAGGWQVKETSGAVTDVEAEALRARVATQLDAGVPLPDFPTEQEVAALPRRLVYAPVPGLGAAYWHTAPAGLDGSGRPGNVFAHILLDRAPSGPPTSAERWRPADLWRSPDWLTPYNAASVVAATLGPGDRPRPGSLVSADAVVDFVLDPTAWRMGLLAALLDAVHAALAGGPRVVLGVEDVDRAALWIGAVSHLMSAGTSRTFSFSTLERPAGLATAWGMGVHLACVPRADLAALRPAEDVVLLDERENVEMGAWAFAPHVTGRGSRIEVTAWSGLAQVVMLDAGVALDALDALDDLAATVGDHGLAPAWPLAMVALGRPDVMADAHEDAAHVVATASPDRVQEHPDLLELALDAVRRLLGEGAAGAWRHVAPAAPGGRSVVQRLVLHVYAAAALRDPDWLLRAGGVPLPQDAGEAADDELLAVAEQVVDELERRTRDHLGDESVLVRAARVARFADLVVRLGLLRHGPATGPLALRERLQDVVHPAVVPVLLDVEAAGRFLDLAAPLADATVRELLRPLVALEIENEQQAGTGRLGERLHPAVLDLLGWQGQRRPDALDAVVAAAARLDPLDKEHAAALLVTGASAPLPPGAWAVGVVAVLEELQAGHAVAPEPERLFEGFAPRPRELALLVRQYGSTVPDRPLLQALAAEPWTQDLADLVAAVGPGRRGRRPSAGTLAADSVPALAELRVVADDLVTRVDDAQALRLAATRLTDLVDGLPSLPAALSDDAVAAARVALVASCLLWAVPMPDRVPDPTHPVWGDVVARRLPRDVDERCVRLLDRWIAGQLLDVDALVRLVVCGAPTFPQAALVPAPAPVLAAVPTTVGAAGAGLLEHVLHLRLAAAGQVDVLAHARTLADWAEAELRRRRVPAVDVHDAALRCERFAESRLRPLVPKGGLLNGAFARFRRP